MIILAERVFGDAATSTGFWLIVINPDTDYTSGLRQKTGGVGAALRIAGHPSHVPVAALGDPA